VSEFMPLVAALALVVAALGLLAAFGCWLCDAVAEDIEDLAARDAEERRAEQCARLVHGTDRDGTEPLWSEPR
jgi:hypothetical protein